MKHSPPRVRKLLWAVLAACYGILAVAATGPHAHDLQLSISGAPRLSPPAAAVERPVSKDSAGPSGRLAHCRLCAWSRSTARPAFALSTSEAEPPAVALRPILEQSLAENPLPANALLRGPPQA